MEKLVACIAQVWFWPILPHKLSSNLEGSGGVFYELWSSVLSIDYQLDSSQVIDWAILAALFSFSETNWEFPSFNYMKSASTICWKTAPHHDVPTSKLHCWYSVFGMMCGAISPPNMVCAVTSKEFNFGLICPDYILPVFHRLVQMHWVSSRNFPHTCRQEESFDEKRSGRRRGPHRQHTWILQVQLTDFSKSWRR